MLPIKIKSLQLHYLIVVRLKELFQHITGTKTGKSLSGNVLLMTVYVEELVRRD